MNAIFAQCHTFDQIFRQQNFLLHWDFLLFLTASIYHKLYKNRMKGLVQVSFKLASNCSSDSWSLDYCLCLFACRLI
jgi:hypothetical protein